MAQYSLVLSAAGAIGQGSCATALVKLKMPHNANNRSERLNIPLSLAENQFLQTSNQESAPTLR
jgi:hypothetical protein